MENCVAMVKDGNKNVFGNVKIRMPLALLSDLKIDIHFIFQTLLQIRLMSTIWMLS